MCQNPLVSLLGRSLSSESVSTRPIRGCSLDLHCPGAQTSASLPRNLRLYQAAGDSGAVVPLENPQPEPSLHPGTGPALCPLQSFRAACMSWFPPLGWQNGPGCTGPVPRAATNPSTPRHQHPSRCLWPTGYSSAWGPERTDLTSLFAIA